jgi:hypothetical protein
MLPVCKFVAGGSNFSNSAIRKTFVWRDGRFGTALFAARQTLPVFWGIPFAAGEGKGRAVPAQRVVILRQASSVSLSGAGPKMSAPHQENVPSLSGGKLSRHRPKCEAVGAVRAGSSSCRASPFREIGGARCAAEPRKSQSFHA